ncbi:hypothetical protein CG719_22175 [Streptomyces sp. CB01373]|nr:hypothetical protein CG719_22175 [Streptomyces sp. CB01373]
MRDDLYKECTGTHSIGLWCSDGPWEKLTTYICSTCTAGARRVAGGHAERDRVRPTTTAVDQGEEL